MYHIMSGDWKEDVYSIHRSGSPSSSSLVVCGLTFDQAKLVKDELNHLLSDKLNISVEEISENTPMQQQ